MVIGPFEAREDQLRYKGNKIFSSLKEVRNIKPPDMSKRHLEIKSNTHLEDIVVLFDSVHKACNKFMEKRKVIFFDLPITTRMISSPGALTGTIPSDVNPFKIKFFDQTTFLTQSSQLYLEFAINARNIKEVYCWDKSFRMEPADFRHLPEFTHIEYEGRINFNQNLKLQESFLKYLINFLLKNEIEKLKTFVSDEYIDGMKSVCNMRRFPRIKFFDAFEILYNHTKNRKYKNVTIKNFGAFEETLLTQIFDNQPVFVTNYISDEVAFYHANSKDDSNLVENADLMFPGYGELIGSGERVYTREDTMKKAKYFKLNMDDYRAYIESRHEKNPIIHSGWGMGIERFIQCVLSLPFIWETKAFPRVHNSNKP